MLCFNLSIKIIQQLKATISERLQVSFLSVAQNQLLSQHGPPHWLCECTNPFHNFLDENNCASFLFYTVKRLLAIPKQFLYMLIKTMLFFQCDKLLFQVFTMRKTYLLQFNFQSLPFISGNLVTAAGISEITQHICQLK